MVIDKNPLISVIVPVYNVRPFLDTSLPTVTEQTYKNLEILLIDDGSTDGSGAVCDAWALKDPRIRVIHQENSGLSGARNTGLDAASGEFILFFDSDDLLSPELCRVLMDAMSPDVNITMCNWVHIFPNKAYTFELSSQRSLLSAEEVIRRIWYQKDQLPSVCAKLYRRHIFDRHRFTPNLCFEDVDIIHHLLWTAEKTAYIPARLYGYVHREDSITTKDFSLKELDILDISQRLLTFAEDKPALQKPAESYITTAAFRIYLNAPKTPEFEAGIRRAEALMALYGKQVLKDPNIRRKNRYALYLYFLCKPLLRFVYRFVDRWA